LTKFDGILHGYSILSAETFQVFMTMRRQIAVFWVLTPCSNRGGGGGGGSIALRSVGVLLSHYTASESRRWSRKCPPKPWYPTTSIYVVATLKMEQEMSSETVVDETIIVKFLINENAKPAEMLMRLGAQFGDETLSRTLAYDCSKSFKEGRTE
jgi:hypothetical protein